MRRLDRYVAGEFLRIYVLFSLAAPMLFILGDWTDNLGDFADRGLTLQQVALGYFYQFPMFILWSLPIAALLGTVFTVSNMARHSELAAAKASGISFFRAVAVLPVLGALLTALGLALGELVPVAMEKRAQVLGESRLLQATRGDFVYRAASGEVFSIRRLDAHAGRMTGLSIVKDGGRGPQPVTLIYARDALYEAGTGWTLQDGFVRVYRADDVEQVVHFETFATLHRPEIRETPEQLLAIPRDDKEMSYAELGATIDRLERSGGRPLDLRVKRAQKIAIPAATFIIILFGAPLANASARGGPAYGIGISLGITIFYLLFFKISGAAGATGQIPPVTAAWLPNWVFLAGAVVLLARVRT